MATATTTQEIEMTTTEKITIADLVRVPGTSHYNVNRYSLWPVSHAGSGGYVRFDLVKWRAEGGELVVAENVTKRQAVDFINNANGCQVTA